MSLPNQSIIISILFVEEDDHGMEVERQWLVCRIKVQIGDEQQDNRLVANGHE